MGVAGTIGLLVSHLKCLVDVNVGGRHLSALESLNLNEVLFEELEGTSAGGALVAELTQVGNLLKLLNDDLARELGGVAVASSQARKLIWLQACELESKKVVKSWSSSPSPLGRMGLFNATKEGLQSLQEQQECALALSLEMSRQGASGLAPVRKIPDVATGQGSTISKAASVASKKKKARNAKRRKTNKPASSTEPPTKKTTPGGTPASKD